MKFSYCLSVRKKPVGFPVVMIIPSRTKNVLGWQLAFTHPARSFPLNIGTNPSSFVSASAGEARTQSKSS